MAVSTSGVYTPNLSSVAGVHAMMQRLYDHLVAVGLTPITDGTYYDGSPSGSATQVPTTNGTFSSWMGFNFTDPAQSTYPLAVWFRLAAALFTDATPANVRWCIDARISYGADGSGNPLGVIASPVHVKTTWMNDASYAMTGYACPGDRVRYSGDALTVILAARSTSTAASTPANHRNYVTLHVERRRNKVTGDIEGGYAWFWLPINTGTYASSLLNGAYNVTPDIATVSVSTPTLLPHYALATRPLIRRFRSEDGSAIVSPIVYEDANGRASLFTKLFMVPPEFVADMAEYTLDFAGTEQRYLCDRNTYCVYGNPSSDYYLTPLFEWEA